MKIRVEFVNKEELDKFINDIEKLYNINYISKVYYNRKPSEVKRVYIDVTLE